MVKTITVITDNNELYFDDGITQTIQERIGGKEHIYIGISATSISYVTVSYPALCSSYTECLERIERVTKQENMYALHLILDDYHYVSDDESSHDTRTSSFDITVKTKSKIQGTSHFNITQNGCDVKCIIFKAHGAQAQIGLSSIGTGQTTLEYSHDANNWDQFTTATTVTIPKDASVYVRGKMTGNNTDESFTNFTTSGNSATTVSVSGELKALWNYENLGQGMFDYCGFNLFSGCTKITTVNEMNFNKASDALSRSCYRQMFLNCIKLTVAPELPATKLAEACYRSMFNGCTSLNSAPELRAMELAVRCYSNMFYKCTNLTTAPDLPATMLDGYCYYAMFYECTNLTEVPEILPATTLGEYCYYAMFQRCTNLTSAPDLPATTLYPQCYEGMFKGCTNLAEVPEILPATTLPDGIYTGPMENRQPVAVADGCYAYMFSQCQSLVNTPILPAKRLAVSCYSHIFSESPNIGSVTILAEDLTINTLETTFANNMSPTLCLFHYNPSPIIATIKLTASAKAQFDADSIIEPIYTHKPPLEKRHTLTQQEIDDIVERYNIHYDD